jgi:hypothetical protein
MAPTAESVIRSNLTVYSGHLNVAFYQSCQKQLHKIALQIQNYDHFKTGETIDKKVGDAIAQRPRKYFVGGVDRSGHLQSIKASELMAAGVHAYDYKRSNATKFMEGDCHDELSSSGAKKEGILRGYAVIGSDAMLTVTTSDAKKSPLALMVLGQDRGINIDWEEVGRRYPSGSSNDLEGFSPGRNFSRKSDFYKAFPWITDINDLVLELPDRKASVGGLDEKTGVAVAGDLFECSADWRNKASIITYQNCKDDLSEKKVIDEFNRILDNNAKELRTSFSHLMDQIGTLETMCEDTVDKSYVILNAVGPNSGRKAKATVMRGAHAGKEDEVEHMDSGNAPAIISSIESMSPEYIRDNVRAITISESLGTEAKSRAKYFESKGIINYGFTANQKSPIVKKHPERWIIIPNDVFYHLKPSNIKPSSGSKVPQLDIAPFQFAILAGLDSVTSFWIAKRGLDVYDSHKTGL